MPKCHFKSEQERRDAELNCLYEIANVLPEFLEERGFTAEPANGVQESCSSLLNPEVKPYYRDYVLIMKKMSISLFTLHFMIIVHEVIWKYSFGPR